MDSTLAQLINEIIRVSHENQQLKQRLEKQPESQTAASAHSD